MSTMHVLLPPLARFAEAPGFARWLARGDRLPDLPDARDATLRALFDLNDDMIPVAALRHRAHADDAGLGTWLGADPAYVRSEATGARLMAWPIVDLTADDAAALAADLRPFFEGAGMPLCIDAASAWCVRVSAGTPQVEFTRADEALGANLLDCLPRGDAGRPWRRLFNEVQVALHAHPVNSARSVAGKLPVNALWFWGAGVLPERVATSLTWVASESGVLRGLAKLANIVCDEPSPAMIAATDPTGDVLLDLDSSTHLANVESWLAYFQRSLHAHRFDAVALTFADGACFCVRHSHRLRFWRRG